MFNFKHCLKMERKNQVRDDIHFRVLRHLEENPHLSQRELADALGVSLGRVNYLLKALIEKGQIKIGAFRRSGDKLNKIAYLLTPSGMSSRAALTREYLERKTREYEALRAELDALRAEVAGQPAESAARGKPGHQKSREFSR